jgi:hypothetical protein
MEFRHDNRLDVRFRRCDSRPDLLALVRAAFDAWEAALDIDFVEVADSAASNIRLGWDAIDGEYGMVGQMAYTYYDND